ncbi:Cullin-1 [Cichlidogyrus casuarinus]|uniref:Cullin-1 n=1 Tax=Cichlidogyrus casuarinus TaxID=1844966 RepID=A0ABD2PWG9_9PLAT
MAQDNIFFVWDELKGGIDDIFKLKNMKKDRYMKLYTQIYDYCTFVNSQNRHIPSPSQSESSGKLVGTELYKKLREYLKQHVQSVKIKGDGLKGEEMLSYFQKSWSDFRFSAIVLNGACAYLNKNWIKREYEEGRKNVVVVYCLALTMWREYLFKPHCTDLVCAILKEIEKERKGEPIYVIRLRKIIECLVELGITGEPSLTISVNCSSLLGTPIPTVASTPTNREWVSFHSI